MIVVGVILIVTGQLWAADWPAPEGTGTRYTNWICTRDTGYCGIGTCFTYCSCSPNEIGVCTQHNYMVRVDTRSYGSCNGFSLGAYCDSWPYYYCAYVQFSDFSDCNLTAEDCDTFIWVGGGTCTPIL